MGAPHTPRRVIVLVVVAGLGVCLMAAASMDPVDLEPLPAWAAFAAGLVALVAALVALWRFERERDRRLG